MLTLMCISFCGYFFLMRKQTVTLTGEWFQSHGGTREKYNGELTFTWKDGRVTMKYDGTQMEMDGYPLYENGGNTLFLPKAMLWVQQESEKYNRVEYFSTLTMEDEGAFLQDGNRSMTAAEGFLYDGGDVYVFLEPVTLSWGRWTELPAGSTVVVRYGSDLNIYGYKAGSYYEEISYDTDVTASFQNGDTVNLSKDRLKEANGSWKLIPVAPELFDRIGG